ncbi:haloacid dehalogenase type II [Apibacter adventoris]|uniref:Haloacid dehalogenase type II n=1 Tax=Apibacter adventoris TaxID=1679466 RepID=A0A2S8AEF2_9FLAO|nr:haloacid dehalogenase type II [Apibacter adventoris]PQL93464.1 haloacid dehalogenase type II [Apibacter adventoris]
MKTNQLILKPKVLFFDINETILNTDPLRSFLSYKFGENAYDLWFSKLLHYSLVSTVTDTYKNFGLIAIDALKVVFNLKRTDFTADTSTQLLNILSSLPAFPDVLKALEILKEKGYLIVALSNSSEDLLKRQLTNAKIDYLFDKQISTEIFQSYKPHRDVYLKAAYLLNTPIKECMLVASHNWDVYGALCAGLRAAFIKRSEQQAYFLSLKPDIEGIGLLSLFQEL